MPEKTIKRLLTATLEPADNDGPMFLTVESWSTPSAATVELKTIALQFGQDMLRGTEHEEE
jgi:hypothetical protein